MYKLYFILFCAIFCVSCCKKYKIEGVSSISLLDGKMLYIKVPIGDKWMDLDSAEVIHGLFKMEGRVDSAILASLYIGDECIMPFVIEKGHININIDNAGISIKGTPLNDCFNNFVIQKNYLDDQVYDVEHEESRMIMDGKDLKTVREEIGVKRFKLYQEMNQLAKIFIQNNYNNVLGPGVFIMLCNGMPYPVMTPVMEEIFDEAPETFKNHPLIKEYVATARCNMAKMEIVN